MIIDTILAFVVSSCLYYYFNRDIREAVLFSLLFVVIFLTLLNAIKYFLFKKNLTN